MAPVLLRKGSVKDILRETESGPARLRFRFSDRYSIYDWGEMPDAIPGKGAALARMGRAFFALLDRAGIPHHAVQDDASLAALRDDELVVTEVAVPPKGSAPPVVEAYYADRPEHALVPLEVIFRFGVPLGSSLLKRDPSLVVGQRFEQPRLDFTTKLEPQDRLLTPAEAQRLAGLTDGEWTTLCTLTARAADVVRAEVARIGLELWDGKFEFAFGARDAASGDRAIIVADSIGIDELRLTGFGAPISKEILRQQYAGSAWLAALEVAKKAAPDAFRAHCETALGQSPAPLGARRLDAVSTLYRVVADCIGAAEVPAAATHALRSAIEVLMARPRPVPDHVTSLIIGSGGREHAIANALLTDARTTRVLVAPGNAGMALDPRIETRSARTLDAIGALIETESIQLVLFGPEQPLLDGWSDALRQRFGAGLAVFGPSKAAAQLEGSKRDAKRVMKAAEIQTAGFDVALTLDEALTALAARQARGDDGVVLKASGPALGKGVVVTRSFDEARAVATAWFTEGAPGIDDGLVLEDRLSGEEVSCFYACVGEQFVHLGDACDYKRISDGDAGPNTGGMGAFSPVPWLAPETRTAVERDVLAPTLRQLVQEGRPYQGILFLGLMLDGGSPWLLEYNTRLGDPEAQVLLPRLRSGWLDLVWAIGNGDAEALAQVPLRSEGAAVHVVRAAAGYPAAPETGRPITVLSTPGAIVTFAGVRAGAQGLETSGGRVLGVTGVAPTLDKARAVAYAALQGATFTGAHSRTDIAGDRRACIRVAILASGTGTNARKLLESATDLGRVRIALLIVDRADSPILRWAPVDFPGVEMRLIDDKDRRAQEASVLEALTTSRIDWCFLAGYMRLVSRDFIARFSSGDGASRLLNLHPALLPEFKGLHAYERAYASGLSRSGVTLHRVDAGMDTGPVVTQAAFARLPSDTLATFVARGQALEWTLFPRALRLLDARGELPVVSDRHYRAVFIIETLRGLGSDAPEPVSQWFWVESDVALPSASELEALGGRLCDAVDQRLTVDLDRWLARDARPLQVVVLKPGVTDNAARSFEECLAALPGFRHEGRVRVFSGLAARFDGATPPLRANPLVEESITIRASGPRGLEAEADTLRHLWRGGTLDRGTGHVETIPLLDWEGPRLDAESAARTWALSRSELEVIQGWYRRQDVQVDRLAAGLPAAPTDAELEVLAQTWSEHCKHKIFAAKITYRDQRESFVVDGLFRTYIKAPTERIRAQKPHAISVFSDNAGIVRYDDAVDVCIKVETHNSPSALDPYGGALTGILGVNRDILGTGIGAKPIANTNVLCFGLPDEPGPLPVGLKHPRDVLHGVHRGIEDGGNKSGIPTVNGAIFFHPAYSGKPVVYCGTVGVLPHTVAGHPSADKRHRPGDLIVMVGGDVGYDGIHGATASSLALDATTPSAMVQIGDPLTQKRVIDLVLAARDLGLFTSLTDNGAGGLSSSVGEMADTLPGRGGAHVWLERVPLKAAGLTPWQILVSESQERMTLAVPPECEAALLALAADFGVHVTTVGVFTDTGRFEASHAGHPIMRLDLDLLHRGLPQMTLDADWEGPKAEPEWRPSPPPRPACPTEPAELLAAALAHPNIGSKLAWVRQFDQEVQGATALKPFEGVQADGQPRPIANDAGIIWLGAHGAAAPYSGVGIACGMAPELSAIDAAHMTEMAVDEAVRNLVVTGVDPDTIALLDNYVWPNPLPDAGRGSHLLAQLVRSARALASMVDTYAMPLVSGKDSMKNDYRGKLPDGAPCAIHVLPTLLVTAIGHHPDVRRIVKTQARPGAHVHRLGPDVGPRVHAGSWVERTFGEVPLTLETAWNYGAFRAGYLWLYEAIAAGLIDAAHDVSDGGAAVTLAEMLFHGGLGFSPTERDAWDWFAERPGSVLLAIRPDHVPAFEARFQAAGLAGLRLDRLGHVVDGGEVRLSPTGTSVPIERLYRAWSSPGPAGQGERP